MTPPSNSVANSASTPGAGRIFLAPAKLNLALAITGRRPDGYHEIDTVMTTVSFADELRIEPTGGSELEFSVLPNAGTDAGPDVGADAGERARAILAAVPNDDDNLVARAWRRLVARFPDRPLGARIELRKRVPPGAGLGGGSSDAATALLGLNEVFALGLSKDELALEAAALGSDVPFFLEPTGLARARGRGEIVKSLGFVTPDLPLVVVRPDFESPTAAAYRGLAPGDFDLADRARERVAEVIEALRAGSREALARAMFNAFERSLRAGDARYDATLEAMRAQGLEAPRITGSGSACFALAETDDHAERAAAELRARFPFACATRMGRPAVMSA